MVEADAVVGREGTVVDGDTVFDGLHVDLAVLGIYRGLYGSDGTGEVPGHLQAAVDALADGDTIVGRGAEPLVEGDIDGFHSTFGTEEVAFGPGGGDGYTDGEGHGVDDEAREELLAAVHLVVEHDIHPGVHHGQADEHAHAEPFLAQLYACAEGGDKGDDKTVERPRYPVDHEGVFAEIERDGDDAGEQEDEVAQDARADRLDQGPLEPHAERMSLHAHVAEGEGKEEVLAQAEDGEVLQMGGILVEGYLCLGSA